MNEESQVPKPEIQESKPLSISNVIPEFNPATETLEEYCEVLKAVILENLTAFGKETVRVRQLLVQIRSATNLNSVKRLAREFMEQRGGV